MSFDFSTTPLVRFGWGRAGEAAGLAAAFGRRALVVTGRSSARATAVTRELEHVGLVEQRFSVEGEPSVSTVEAGARVARSGRCDVVIAIGGGSALDAGKAIAALAANEGDLFDYLETIGRAQPLERPALPVVAVPTTAGTGSEATRNAVVCSDTHHVKVSLRHGSMMPRAAVVDPELAVDLPSMVTATTGLDALTQLIEPYVSRRANPFVDTLVLAGLGRVARSLRVAVARPTDVDARSDMALAALWSGMALSNAGLGAVHGLAGPLGGILGAPHGALCAALLPHVMAMNIAALRREGGEVTLSRYDHVARVLTGRAQATADDGVAWVRELVSDLRVPGLASYGFADSVTAAVVEGAARASSMKANPVVLSSDELRAILDAAV